MHRISKYVFVCLLILFSCFSYGTEKVVLQLNGEHEFKFAGYYAALWQGFYESEGLEVEIRSASLPDGSTVSPAQQLLKGRADFAVGATDILFNRDQGKAFVVLASIFQRSPNRVFSLPEQAITSVADLAKLKIGVSSDSTRDEVYALLSENGIDLNTVERADVAPTIDSLLKGEAGAIAADGVSLNYAAKEQGVTLNQIDLAANGVQFYGDSLYTHQNIINARPEVVTKFLQATLKGWQFALQHKTELADKISSDLPRYTFSYDDLKSYNLAFAGVAEDYMNYPLSEIGHNNQARWQAIHAQLGKLGLIKNAWEKEFIFDGVNHAEPRQNILSLPAAFAFVTSILIILTLYFIRREITIWLPCFFLVFAAGLAEIYLEANLKKEQYLQTSAHTVSHLNAISTKLSGELNNNLALISATAAYIGVNPDINEVDFERFAKPLFRKEPLLVSLVAAKDMVVNLVYPKAGNEAVLGLDYLKNYAQRDGVLQVERMNSRIITDPVELVQGGRALIGRVGVYSEGPMGQPFFWGIVSGPILTADLFERVGLLNEKLPINVAIRHKDNLGQAGPVFFGEDTTFSDTNAVSTTLGVGDTTWTLAATPKSGWYTVSTDLWILRFITVIITVMLLLFLTFRHRHRRQAKLYEQQLHQSKMLLNGVGELALIGPWQINPKGHISNWHPQTSKILGLPFPVKGDLLKNLTASFPEDQLQQLKQEIVHAREVGQPFDLEIYRVDKHQNLRWLRFIGDVTSVDGNSYDILGAVQDISERKHSHELIQYQASYDNLTGLPNRMLLNESFEKSIAKAKRDNKKLAVLFVDLDHFKPINDSLGHKAGDKVLKEVAARIKSCIRASDTAARYSGDEFIILLQDVDDGSGSLPVAEQVIHSINQAIHIDEREVFCGASIGIAIYPEDGETGETLISNADQAMYVAKNTGRNNWHYFTDAMQANSEKRQRMHSKLVTALSNNDLMVHYQPIIDLKTGKISKCESLVRWVELDGKQISTEEFIGLAEEMGVINDIDFFVLERAGRELTQLMASQQHKIGLSVNVSPRIFSAKDKSLSKWITLVKEVAKTIDVTVEITERVLTQDSKKALRALTQLKDAGINIAIDDFGTGYSSLSYLTKFPIDFIKIDRSFISNIGVNESDETLTETIIGLASKLSMKVVAEGIETQQQLDFIKALGCDYAQGYLLGKPQSADEFLKLLESQQLPAAIVPAEID